MKFPIPPALVLAIAAAACGSPVDRVTGAGTAPTPKTPPPFTEVALTAPDGLSGLCADADGVMWSVAEREHELARITLGPDGTTATVEAFPIAGVPPMTDLEGTEILPDGTVMISTEGKGVGVASLLTAQRRGDGFEITGALPMPADRLGVNLISNHGAEALCGDAHQLAVGIEIVGVAGTRRWAPIVRVVDGAVAAVQKLWLTSTEGKLGALDCEVAADGALTGWGVERHYGVTRVIRFELPPPGTRGDEGQARVAADLEPWLHGRLNLEGIAELPDGRVVIVNDNATAKITGPTELLVFAPGALVPAPPPPRR